MESIPHELQWIGIPVTYSITNDKLNIHAGPETDMFIDPGGEYAVLNAPKALFQVKGEFQFSAKVKPEFKTDYDAGVLILYAGKEYWAKLCFEYSPQHEPMVVSVVTNRVSDDANSTLIQGDEVFLRISGWGRVYAFHYSIDGKFWHFVRYFRLDANDIVKIGFSSQSPRGKSCISAFSEIEFQPKKLVNLRNGS
jgi:regulation of enolase protein 1 (concanavalin A-like superfamily)